MQSMEKNKKVKWNSPTGLLKIFNLWQC